MAAAGWLARGAALLAPLALVGCAVTPPSLLTGSSPAPASTVRPPSTATPEPTRSASATRPPESPAAKPAPDERTGKDLATPYAVAGVVVVSKQHPVSAGYVPAGRTGPHQLAAPAAAALERMTAAARADGVRLVVRSGYRSYATQAAIFRRQVARYPSEELARRYNATAGRSEHQTGLAVDLWDGVTWGVGIRNTAAGKWLWQHAREYGFILRYPPGKEKVTGYAYEPWHFRYLGTGHSLKFKPKSTITLEEYLGLA